MDSKRSGISNDIKILLLIFGFPLILLVLIGGPWVYHEFIYKIRDEIGTGSKYGFTIGMSMEEALPGVKKHLEDGNSKELSAFYDKGRQLDDGSLTRLEHFTFPLSEGQVMRLFSVNTWHITFDPKASYFDQLALYFENGILVLMRRSRHWDLTL